MPERLLDYTELRSIHGVPYTRQWLSSLEKAGRFPRRLTFNGKVRWLQSEIEAWIAEQARTCRGGGHDPRVWVADRDIEGAAQT
jgi:predicted DNA-binding transcriptional regulator AlpA